MSGSDTALCRVLALRVLPVVLAAHLSGRQQALPSVLGARVRDH
jgi:hypothetical protein